jgi:hypothetical protein
MSAVITDDLLVNFTVEGTWATIADAIAERYEGIATRVVHYFGAIAWTEEPHELNRWRDVTRALASA